MKTRKLKIAKNKHQFKEQTKSIIIKKTSILKTRKSTITRKNINANNK